MFPLSFDFLVLDPEINSARLTAVPGVTGLFTAAGAYTSVHEAMSAAADGSDGSMRTAAATWSGAAHEQAQQAFGQHTEWIRAQAGVAAQAAYLTTQVAEANAAAIGVMPKLPEILLVKHALEAAMVASSVGMQVSTPALAILTAARNAQRILAASVMLAYAQAATTLLGLLPTPLPGPAIVTAAPPTAGAAVLEAVELLPYAAPGGGEGALRSMPAHVGGGPDHVAAGSRGSTGVPGSPAGGGGGAAGSAPTGSAPAGSTPVGSGSGQPDVGQAGGTQSVGGQPSSSLPDQQQPISGMPQEFSPSDNSSGDPIGTDGAAPDVSGLLDDPSSSTTLASLNNGGNGSTVSLGMIRGGVSAMPGVATGFRMPAAIATQTSRAFGAVPGPTPVSPVAPRQAPRGVSASPPRRRQDERRTTTVVTTGRSQDAPQLDQASSIGVLEYDDGDGQPASAAEQLLEFGVLDRNADD
ncbi:PPE domain-containing protein [Nocardia tengchongensis]|uniref:PPE domain-containing protein n=1 Tax=Nocardia tengchongensis TaxID=2055889 RepID=UPI0036B7ABB0